MCNKLILFLITFSFSLLSFGQKEHYLEPIIVKKGESLWSLSEEHFGDGQKFKTFWTVSKTKGLTNNPDKIYPEMVLYKLSKKEPIKFPEINYTFFKEEFNDIKYELSKLIVNETNTTKNGLLDFFISFIISLLSGFIVSIIMKKIFKDNPIINYVISISFSYLIFILLVVLNFIKKLTFKIPTIDNKLIINFVLILILVLLILLIFFILNYIRKILKIESLKEKEKEEMLKKSHSHIINIDINSFLGFLCNLQNSISKPEFKKWIYVWRLNGYTDISKSLKEIENKYNQNSQDFKNDKTIYNNIADILDNIYLNFKNKI